MASRRTENPPGVEAGRAARDPGQGLDQGRIIRGELDGVTIGLRSPAGQIRIADHELPPHQPVAHAASDPPAGFEANQSAEWVVARVAAANSTERSSVTRRWKAIAVSDRFPEALLNLLLCSSLRVMSCVRSPLRHGPMSFARDRDTRCDRGASERPARCKSVNVARHSLSNPRCAGLLSVCVRLP